MGSSRRALTLVSCSLGWRLASQLSLQMRPPLPVRMVDPLLQVTRYGPGASQEALVECLANQVENPWSIRDDGTPYLYGDGWFDDSGYFFGVMFTQEPGESGIAGMRFARM